MKRRADRSLFDRNVKLPISYYRETFLNYTRKVYKNGSSSPSTNERYIHRGYLRLGALNMNNGADFYQALLWDPTEPQATRPLALLNNDGTYYYGHDFNKNVTELFNSNGDIVNHYDYRPYGDLLESSESIPNPIQYSSEIHDSELGLISYNYRYYNPEDGGFNLYGFVENNSIMWFDYLGGKVIKDLKAEYCTNKVGFFKESENKVTGMPSQADIDKLLKIVEQTEAIVDKCGRKCYDIDLYLMAVNINGIKVLPWQGYDRAILLAHTTPGEYRNAPRKFFDIGSISAHKNDLTKIANTKISNKVDIVGCHLQINGIGQIKGLLIIADKLKALKAKEDCSVAERIQIVSGTIGQYIILLFCVFCFMTSASLNAASLFEENKDDSDPFTKFAQKDLRFKATERFNDLLERYRNVIGYYFDEYRNTRFCLDGFQASFNYFMPCIGGAKAWQLPRGAYTFSDPSDGSPSEFYPDPRRPPSKKFKFVKVIYDSSSYVYGDKTYRKGELQTLITDIVLDRFYFHNRLPYSYYIFILDNPPLKECWYFMAILHLFAENRIVYADTAG